MVQALSRFCVIAALALSSSSLHAGAQADTPTGQVPQIAFEKYVLENGLEVILSEDHRLPLTAVNLWYHVGAGQRSAGTHRLRAPVRAHDVPGVEARRQRHPFQGPRGGGRLPDQRDDGF